MRERAASVRLFFSIPRPSAWGRGIVVAGAPHRRRVARIILPLLAGVI